MSPGGPLDFEPDAADEPDRGADAPGAPAPADAGAARTGPAGGEPAGPAAPNGPPRGFASPEPDGRRPSRRYGAFLMVAALALIGIVTVNTISSHGPGSAGVPDGKMAPPFAAPLAGGTVTGDVNVATVDDQGDAGKVPACSVRLEGVLTSCLVTNSGPTVIAFFVTLGSRCANELDTLQQVGHTIPQVRVVAVAIRGDRGKAARLARDRGWSFPVAYDHDGILANLYGVAVCPHLTFVLPGGRVQATTIGSIDAVRLRAQMEELLRAARRDGWTGP